MPGNENEYEHHFVEHEQETKVSKDLKSIDNPSGLDTSIVINAFGCRMLIKNLRLQDNDMTNTPTMTSFTWTFKPLLRMLTFCFVLLACHTNCFAGKNDKLEKQVDAIESQMNKARDLFIKSLERAKTQLLKAPINPQAKRELIKVIESEISEFKNTGIPPDHADLIECSIQFGIKTANIIQRAEDLRLLVIDAATRNEGPLSRDELENLESRLDQVLTGAVDWKVNDKWGGKRTYPNAESQTLELTIHKVVGNSFEGILVQSYQNGTSDQMNVQGMRVGCNFMMETTAMRLGKARILKFNGVVIGNRILADVSGVAFNGQPATGFVKLFR